MGVVLVGPDITGDGVVDADITVATSFVTINDAIFTDAVNAGSGTGGYNTFLAIKDQTGGEVPQDFYEAGFNANDTNPLDDTNDEIDPSKTHTVRLSDLVIVTVGTVQYYEFRVDLNENNDAVDTQISLDQFKLYTSTSGAIQSTTQEVNGAPSLFSQNLVYDMDAGQNVSVLLDEANSTGSGTDDYSVLVPISKFADLDPATTYIYLYAEMGRADGSGDGPSNNWTADGGFEEWNIQNGVTLIGTKFNDLDGDGVKDANEGPVAGVTIFIDADRDGQYDVGERSTTTDINGNYTFYGVARGQEIFIDEVIPTGSTQTTGTHEVVNISKTAVPGSIIVVDPIGNFNPIDLSGTKYLDLNGDGQVVGDGGMGNVTIFIDMDGDAAFDAGELSTTTAADGTWSFAGLSSTVIGKKVYEVLPSGYVQTIGAAGYTIVGDASGLVFANFERFNISGTKVIDTNGDGILQAGETTAHAGVTIFIDQDNDGVLDASELSTTTGLNGSWSFNNLGAGYAGATVRELASGDYITTVGANGIAVTGTSGADQTGLVFANFERFNISGTKVIDTNGDGILQAGETTAHAGVTIFIDQDNDGVLDASELSTTTGLNGSWSFNNLGAGYAGATVRELASGDYITTVGANGIAVTGTSGADQTGLVFANFERFNISGTKVIDTNGDGILQAGETTAHAGVTIFIDQDNDGVLDASELSTTTGLNGSWSFNNLGAGYAGATVRELASGDYITTVGANGIAVTGTSGADQTGLVFANFERFNISGTKVIDTNGDGILQAGETTAHAGVTIFIDQDNDGVLDASELSTTTGLNGSWSFNNLGAGYAGATVRELASGDYITTVGANGIAVTGTSGADQTGLVFANFERFNISGTKVIDTNGDGILQAGETTAHAGVTIFIDQDNDGVLDASELSTTTGLNGSWSFNNLGAGYAGATVRELASGDYITTVGANGIAVTGTSGADQTGLVFANFERFNISGTKVIDTNGDGILQAGETTAHAGVTIFIDQDNDGVLDASELSTTTGLNGSWSFNNLGAGYAGATVRELASGDYITTVGANGIAVTGTSGADQTGLVFANFERFNISGTKVIDTNGDGILQAGETTAHAGVTIFIDQDNDGVLDASELSTTTGLNGSWSFNNLGAGYAGATVRELASGDYITTVGANGIAVTGTSGADQTGLVFANFERFNISGTKVIDTNGDGILQAGETTAHAGVTIFIDQDNDGVLDASELSTTTGLNGSWSFNNLGAGYAGATVRELVSGGYVTTIGADGFTVTGTSGADQTGLVFANFLPAPSIELIKYVSVNSTDGTDGLFVDANNDLGPENVNIGTDVWFKVTLDNTGNVALTGVDVEDINTTTGLPGSTFDLMVDGVLTLDAVNNYGATLSGDANGDGDLDVDEIWTITYYQDFDAGNHINTAYVTTDQGASDNDLARYYSMINEGPGVRTPGFWQNMNNGGQFWDGRADNEKNAGQDCFADGELLYAVDGDGNGVIDPFIDSNNDGVSDNAGLLIGDYNHDGFTGDNPLTLDVIEGPEDTLFISLADARALINASNKQLNSLSGDGKFMLGRDMVATWLNYLAGNEIGGPTDTKSPRHYLDDAIDWMQSFSGTTGNADESFDIFKLAGSPIKTSGSTWKSPQTGIDHSALQLHNALDYYNNTGQTEYGGKYYAHDCDDLDFAKAVHALSLI